MKGKRPRLMDSDEGVLELPMKLLITVIIMAIALPAAIGGFNAYQEKQAKLELEMELDKIKETIQRVYSSGNGTTRNLDVNIPDRLMAGVDYVKIGDNILPLDSTDPSPYATLIRYKMDGEKVGYIELNLYATSKTWDKPIVLHGGSYELRFVNNNYEGQKHFVSIEFL